MLSSRRPPDIVARGSAQLALTTAALVPTPRTQTRFPLVGSGGSALIGAVAGRKRLRQEAAAGHSRRQLPVRSSDPRLAPDLVLLAVAPGTLQQYRAEVAEFEAWCSSHRRGCRTAPQADQSMRLYFNSLAAQREAPQLGRFCLFGLLLLRLPQLAKTPNAFLWLACP